MDIPMLEQDEWKLVVAAQTTAEESGSTATSEDDDLESFRAAYEAAQERLERYRKSTTTTADDESDLVMAVNTAGREYRNWRRYGPMLREYERITGFRETNPMAIYHHLVWIYGPPCAACGKPLRTPRAKFCAACPD